MYREYLKYVLEHKKNVFKTCWKRGLYLHAFTHDLSKFLPSEFIPYAKWFYGKYGLKLKEVYVFNKVPINRAEEVLHELYSKSKQDFYRAWEHHYKHNKHHWNYWIGKRIPYKYIIQMICDWEAMSLKFGGTAQEYYMNNYDKIDLTVESRCELEFHLGLTGSEALCSNITWKQLCNNWGITMKEDLKRIGYIK